MLGLSPESYLGYLKMGKTPGQIVKEGAELLRLRSIPNEEKTSEQKKREITLAREFYVANDFGYASRFTLYKDEFTKKDIQYAFSELPALDSKVEKNERLNGGFFAGHVPSNAYQAVILRKVFDGMGNLRFEAGKNRKEKMDVLDNYMTEKMNQNKDFMKDILSAYIKGRDAEDADSILESFMVAGMYKYIHSALRLTDLDVDDFDNMTVNIMSYNKTNDWLIDQIRLLRNEAD